jgi:Protein of unknown function (DUF3426)
MTRFIAVVILCATVSTPARAADTVVLESVKTEWQNLYGAIVYGASATAHNTGSAPVRAVKVRLELYDKSGQLVAQRDGYNLAAERLQDAPTSIDQVKPISPGGSDPVRLSIDKSDIGRPFRTAKLVVVEVR